MSPPEIGDWRSIPPEITVDEAPPPAPRRRACWPCRWLLALAIILLLLPAALILPLRWLPPPTTAFMLQSPAKPVQHHWVEAERIAPVLGRAAIAAEDQKFRQHRGFDFESIADAYEERRKRRRARGASTITQQTAKNLFLWQGGGYFRKGLEAWLTVWIELLWPKARILEVYLNIAEFGPGVYGAEAAARAYFGKSAAALTPEEAARLAAVLPSPRRWSAANPGPYVQQRTLWILGQMGHRIPAVTAPEEEPLAPDDDDAPEFDDPLSDDWEDYFRDEYGDAAEPDAEVPEDDATAREAFQDLEEPEEREEIEWPPAPEVHQ
jgi:monofunctional glycosyltransferase